MSAEVSSRPSVLPPSGLSGWQPRRHARSTVVSWCWPTLISSQSRTPSASVTPSASRARTFKLIGPLTPRGSCSEKLVGNFNIIPAIGVNEWLSLCWPPSLTVTAMVRTDGA